MNLETAIVVFFAPVCVVACLVIVAVVARP